MTNSEQSANFPLQDMPRMGRRNAISYPSRILSDDDGAFSPMNLLHTASISDIDPQGAIAQELRFEKRSQAQREHKFSKVGVPAAPVPSVLDGWKKLHDAKNHTFNGIERLFEQTGPLALSVSVMEAKPVRSHTNDLVEKEKAASANHRGNVVIPWRKQDVKPTTVAEERRKLFESFDITSVEPPETPQVSELTLKKMAKKNKRKRKGDSKYSEESLPMSNKTKEAKAPYSDIPPKVNTRWDKGKSNEPQSSQQDSNQVKQKGRNGTDGVDKNNTTKKSSASTENPSASARSKNGDMMPLPAFPVKKQASNTQNKAKLVTNFPASERVKYTTDKLPLTIPPRYNHKKALGMTGYTKPNKIEEDATVPSSSSKLFGTIPRVKHETPKAPAGNSLQSTFFNLQRINNGGAKGTAANNVSKRTTSTGQLVVSRYSANILGTSTIGSSVPQKKPTPLVTTIQAPPSPFLASKISIQSQMMDIPINGERTVAGSSKGNKKENKNDAKSGKLQPLKPNAGVKSKAAPQPQTTKPSQPPAKVVPMLGTIPNKYNNIYIGPYSGSDSEGEPQSLKKKR